MNLVETLARLDESLELHSARILILLGAFASPRQPKPVDGLTKLAKLDFLLRYPVMLQRALEAKGESTRDVRLQEHERYSVESEMVRYRFGPWDHRYREILNLLVARNLATVHLEGRKTVIGLTKEGQKQAKLLSDQNLFHQDARRARLLRRHFDMTATHLMRFIYDTFPEILTLRSDTNIRT